MTAQVQLSHNPNFLRRLLIGALPIGIVCVVIWIGFSTDPPSRELGAAIFGLCAVVLWFGWNAIKRNVVTRLSGYILSAYVALGLGSAIFGIVLNSPFLAGLLILSITVGIPFVLYDLFFRSPQEGRLAAERVNENSSDPNV